MIIRCKKPIILYSIYFLPNSTAKYGTRFLEYLQRLSVSFHPLVLMGDFNATSVNWSSLSGLFVSEISLCNLVFDLNLSQEVESLTHIKGNLLELVLTTSPFLIFDHVSISSQSTYCLQSDRFTVSFCLCTHVYLLCYPLRLPRNMY